MSRLLAIDYGTKRTGLAQTDLLQMIANPIGTVPTHSLFEWLGKYLDGEDVEAIVVGKSVNLDGSETHSTRHIEEFVKALQRKWPKYPVHRVDERFTSKMAQQAIISSGLPKHKRRDKSLTDSIAAAIILQSFLEQRAQ